VFLYYIISRTVSCPKARLLTSRFPRAPETQISEKFRTAKTTWDIDARHHGTEAIPPPPQEVMPGQDAELSGAHGGPDPHGTLAVCCLPQADPEASGRQLLVLSRTGQDHTLARPTPLPK